MMKLRCAVFVRLFFMLMFMYPVFFLSCRGPVKEPVEIDFISGDSPGERQLTNDTLPVLSVAVAPVVSPKESFVYYKDLFDYMSKELGVTIDFRQRMSYEEVNTMLERNAVDLAFICTGAYIERSAGMGLLVAPEFAGKPYYYAYIIVHKDSDIYSFDDLKGRGFAYTDPLSNAGKLYAEKRLHDKGESAEGFFGSTVYTMSHDLSIQMVSRRLVDGASVSSLIYHYVESVHPDIVKDIRIVERSVPFGSPPIVHSLLLPPERKQRIQELLLGLHQTEEGRRILDNLLIDRFVRVEDSLYNSVRSMSRLVWQ
jgi:phosphonate transport system substrate-binding protein